jgi:hypothetical protein
MAVRRDFRRRIDPSGTKPVRVIGIRNKLPEADVQCGLTDHTHYHKGYIIKMMMAAK